MSSSELVVIKAGLIIKQGKNLRNWKLRWFELHTDNTLKYFAVDKRNMKAVQKGEIDLSTCENVLVGPETNDIWPKKYCTKAREVRTRLVIVTKSRQWNLVTESATETASWKCEILNRHEFDKEEESATDADEATSPRSQRARSIISMPDQYNILSNALEGADGISVCSDSDDDS